MGNYCPPQPEKVKNWQTKLVAQTPHMIRRRKVLGSHFDVSTLNKPFQIPMIPHIPESPKCPAPPAVVP